MPIAVGNSSMVAPLSGQSLGLQRAHVSHGIRQLTLCKDKDGKVGVRVKPINNGVFVCLVVDNSPASPRGVAIRRPDLAGERGERGGVHDGEGARHVPQERRQRDQRGREGQALREDDNFAQGQRPVRRVPVQKRQNRHHRQGLVGRQERRTDRPPVARSGRTERGRVEGQADKQDNRRGGGGGHDHGDSELHLRSHGEKVSRR
jgi:hypothetical protein